MIIKHICYVVYSGDMDWCVVCVSTDDQLTTISLYRAEGMYLLTIRDCSVQQGPMPPRAHVCGPYDNISMPQGPTAEDGYSSHT